MNSLKNIRIAPYKTRKKAFESNEAYTQPMYLVEGDQEAEKTRCYQWVIRILMAVVIVAVHVSVLLVILMRM